MEEGERKEENERWREEEGMGKRRRERAGVFFLSVSSLPPSRAPFYTKTREDEENRTYVTKISPDVV